MTEAWVTLATNDSYSMGALTLAASLRGAGTSRQLAVMVTQGVSPPILAALEEAFDQVVRVESLDSGDAAHLALLERPELGVTFTKIRCWSLTQFTKAVFLDADTLVLSNCDELFDREEFSASPDAGWPDCFNSGVFVFRPSVETYASLVELAVSQGSFDGGDQGLLNTFYSSWATEDISKHLPFLYNTVASATYSYLPAFKRFGKDIKIVHFIGSDKPWLGGRGAHGEGGHRARWWDIYSTKVAPRVAHHQEGSPNTGGGGQGWCPPPSQPGWVAPMVQDNRESWEAGRPDYNGSASFGNILNKIEETMKK